MDMTASTAPPRSSNSEVVCALIRVRGLVQGVGFRPTVWRLARALDLSGSVWNDGEGVLIRAIGPEHDVQALCRRLRDEVPPLAHIEALERSPCEPVRTQPEGGFVIELSAATEVRTGVVPDAATCPDCVAEVLSQTDRRHRYAFTNCTHCGPRLSIVRAIPYDRANTSMAAFPMCPDCAREYADPADRRFHAQPNACPVCGPRLWLEAPGCQVSGPSTRAEPDPIDTARRLLEEGHIVAIKGIGGFHLACDATNAEAVEALRRRKGRYAKPFALMARDLGVIRGYCEVDAAAAELIAGPAAPIVLLPATSGADHLAPGIAPALEPGRRTLGFMLPYSPLHHLLLAGWDRPLVMTSGNRSDEPQCIDNDDARQRLQGIADAWLLHDRDIVNRVDDSVVRVMDGAPRPLRRARGYAPAPLILPESMCALPPVLATGGELKNTLCLLRNGQAVLSQHLGDLHDAGTAREFERTIALYRALYQHQPAAIAVDAHPGYRATQVGRQLAEEMEIPLIEVQHHRAHVASVLADNNWSMEAGPVLGIALDGSGYGDDGTVWGGEWFVGGYRDLCRVARLAPVPLPGGSKAILEPWRMLFAHLDAAFGWDRFLDRYADLPIARDLARRPVDLLRRMVAGGLNVPRTSSCGRLFDAVAAALGICIDGIAYEGQAAIELERLGRTSRLASGYRLVQRRMDDLMELDPAPIWAALLEDLERGAPRAEIAVRFHVGLADSLAESSAMLASEHGASAVALSGGVFQNRTLFEGLCAGLRNRGLQVLSHRHVPANDGGLSLGQAVYAGLRLAERGAA